jgi:hypothetical protein
VGQETVEGGAGVEGFDVQGADALYVNWTSGLCLLGCVI